MADERPNVVDGMVNLTARLAFAADAELLLRRLLEAETFTPFTEKEWSSRIAVAMVEARTLLWRLDAPASGVVLPGKG